MGAFEIIVITACALIVVGVIFKSIINKKKGKTCCSDCSSCAYNCKFHKNNEINKKS